MPRFKYVHTDPLSKILKSSHSTPKEKEEAARIITIQALQHGDESAYDSLQNLAIAYPHLFERYFYNHLINHTDSLTQQAFHRGNKKAYDFLIALSTFHPDFFEKHISEHIPKHVDSIVKDALFRDNESAYEFLEMMIEDHPDLFKRYFLDNGKILSESLLSGRAPVKALHKAFNLITAASSSIHIEEPKNITHTMIKLIDHVVNKKMPITKNLLNILSRHSHNKMVRVLHRLGEARGWYLKTLLADPWLLALYLSHATLTNGGKRIHKKLFEILPLLDVAHKLGIDTWEALSPNIEKYREDILEKIKREARRILPKNTHHVIDRNINTLPSLIQYYQKHDDDVVELLKYSGESLFHLKFGHYGLHEKLLSLAKEINSSPPRVSAMATEDLIESIKEEAQREKLHEKKASGVEGRFLEAVRRAYDEIIRKGAEANVDENIIRMLRNTKLAKKLGVGETTSKIISFLDRKKSDIHRLKIAVEPEEHLHAMNMPDSCMWAKGEVSYGALAITGGPALVFYTQDRLGNVSGRVTYILYEDPRGGAVFVPNHNYGGIDVKTPAYKILKERGIPVYEDVTPPYGFVPAKSRFRVKEFWKDGDKDKEVAFQ